MKFTRFLLFSLLLFFAFPVLSHADQYDDAFTAYEKKDFKKASKLLRPLAEENNLKAKTLLGIMYYNGQGVEKDILKGYSMIMNAVKQGHEHAKGIAAGLTIELANTGDVQAMYNAGYMCLKNWGAEEGVEYDSNRCIKWLEKAAEMGHKRAAKVLSQIYKKGEYGISPDKVKASQYRDLAKE